MPVYLIPALSCNCMTMMWNHYYFKNPQYVKTVCKTICKLVKIWSFFFFFFFKCTVLMSVLERDSQLSGSTYLINCVLRSSNGKKWKKLQKNEEPVWSGEYDSDWEAKSIHFCIFQILHSFEFLACILHVSASETEVKCIISGTICPAKGYCHCHYSHLLVSSRKVDGADPKCLLCNEFHV